MQSESRDNQYHPTRLAQALKATLDCYACGHGYTFVGAGAHPGRCERCESQAVSPAGVLDVSLADVDRNYDGTETVVFDARDESDREYAFVVEVGDGTPELETVEIAGKRVTPDSPYWGTGLRFDAVERAVARYVGDPAARLTVREQDGGSA